MRSQGRFVTKKAKEMQFEWILRLQSHATRSSPVHMSKTETVQILSHTPLGRDARLLRLERPSWSWQAGELVSLCGANSTDVRDYTIASAPSDDPLDIVYRRLTPQLVLKQAGYSLEITGPYGRFTLRDPERPILFCATGTGIAPCRAFFRANPGLELTLLHGVRHPEDLYFQEEFSGCTYAPFCSRTPLPGHPPHLTDRLPTVPLAENVHVYLCGANEMIYHAQDILQARGVPADCIFHEAYYYRLDD